MDPSYIYFKEIDIDQDSSFTADFSNKKMKKMWYLTMKMNMV